MTGPRPEDAATEVLDDEREAIGDDFVGELADEIEWRMAAGLDDGDAEQGA